MAIENCSDDPSEWATFTTVAKFFGTSLETFRLWVRRTQFDTGARSTITSDERARLKQLERERKDLRRANAIVPDASIFFAAAFDGQIKRSLLASTSARVNGGSSRSAETCGSPSALTTTRVRVTQFALGQ
jgi:transposase-like protein